MKGLLERHWSWKIIYVIKWKLSEFTYLGVRVSAVVRCESVVKERTRCGWELFRECIELLYGRS